MSVLKVNRKPSQFEVFHHFNKMRKEVTDLILRDFGYDFVKRENKISRHFGNRDFSELTDEEKERYEKLKLRNQAFNKWFINDERQEYVNCPVNGGSCKYIILSPKLEE